MIEGICGDPGAGKTSLMTHFALEAMLNPDIRCKDLYESKKLIDKYNKGGFNYTVPERHLVYADYHIEANKLLKITNWEIDGHKIGLPNDKRETHFFPFYARIFIDEAQGKLNSREGGIENFISRFYEIHRHGHYNIMFTCQRLKLIDLNVRGIVNRIIETVNMKNKTDKYGNVLKTTWTCLEFDNCFLYEQYLNNGKNPKFGKKVKFTHEGDVFKHYDSYGCQASFLHNNYDRDFDRTPSVKIDYTVDSVRQYNDAHPVLTNKLKKED